MGNLADDIKKLALPFVAMVAVIVVANVVVLYPFEPLGLSAWATWGTSVYPLTFLVNDLTNRFYGTKMTTKLVMASFPTAIVIGVIFADARIALASGFAFLISQQLDNIVFDRLRDKMWWLGPLVSSSLASILDTWLFYGAAFVGTTENAAYFGTVAPLWVGWATGDLIFKFFAALVLLLPYRLFLLAVRFPQSDAAP